MTPIHQVLCVKAVCSGLCLCMVTDWVRCKVGVVKLKNSILGAHMSLARIRSSAAVEIIWYLRVVKSGSNYELAPIRPAVTLRRSLPLDGVQRLF